MLKLLHQHRADLVLLENLWHEERPVVTATGPKCRPGRHSNGDSWRPSRQKAPKGRGIEVGTLTEIRDGLAVKKLRRGGASRSAI